MCAFLCVDMYHYGLSMTAAAEKPPRRGMGKGGGGGEGAGRSCRSPQPSQQSKSLLFLKASLSSDIALRLAGLDVNGLQLMIEEQANADEASS